MEYGIMEMDPEFIFGAIINLIVLVFFVPIHNLVQLNLSKKFGDNTAEEQGFNTLSPMVHMTGFSFLSMIMFGFAFARRVPRRFVDHKNHKILNLLVAVSGIFTYVIIAFLLIFASYFTGHTIENSPEAYGTINGYFNMLYLNKDLTAVLMRMSYRCIVMALINLLPVYPLDGGDIISTFISGKHYQNMIRFINRHEGLFSILFLVVIQGLMVSVGTYVGYLAVYGLDKLATGILSIFM